MVRRARGCGELMSRIEAIVNARRFLRSAAIGSGIAFAIVLLAALLFFLEDNLPYRTHLAGEARLSDCTGDHVWRDRGRSGGHDSGSGHPLSPSAQAKAGPPGSGSSSALLRTMFLVLTVSEAGTEVWWRRSRRTTTLPIGGLDPTGPEAEEPKLPAPPEQIQLPREFAEDGSDTTVDVVVVGESSAAGVPYDWWLSIGNIVTWQLEKIIPGSPLPRQDSGGLGRHPRDAAESACRPGAAA